MRGGRNRDSKPKGGARDEDEDEEDCKIGATQGLKTDSLLG